MRGCQWFLPPGCGADALTPFHKSHPHLPTPPQPSIPGIFSGNQFPSQSACHVPSQHRHRELFENPLAGCAAFLSGASACRIIDCAVSTGAVQYRSEPWLHLTTSNPAEKLVKKTGQLDRFSLYSLSLRIGHVTALMADDEPLGFLSQRLRQSCLSSSATPRDNLLTVMIWMCIPSGWCVKLSPEEHEGHNMLILFDSITQTVNVAVKGLPLIFLFRFGTSGGA